ncbi:hypothetical protein LU298_02905 [Komagataeibacter intermedius]|nr:hypothetical protein [Komagataeibacter intermedius]MCF3635452.1 hypothetical protein [Komagataeibacter intermedius]
MRNLARMMMAVAVLGCLAGCDKPKPAGGGSDGGGGPGVSTHGGTAPQQ